VDGRLLCLDGGDRGGGLGGGECGWLGSGW
jgi:hypothetical protein